MSTSLGKIAFCPKGEWKTDTKYKRLDCVVHNNQAYVAIKDVEENYEPSEENTNWKPIFDLTNYYTKDDIISLGGYEKPALNNYYTQEYIKTNYYTKDDIIKLGGDEQPTLNNYYTQKAVQNLGADENSEDVLNYYYTRKAIQNLGADENSEDVLNYYYTRKHIEDKYYTKDDIISLGGDKKPALDNYYTQDETDNLLGISSVGIYNLLTSSTVIDVSAENPTSITTTNGYYKNYRTIELVFRKATKTTTENNSISYSNFDIESITIPITTKTLADFRGTIGNKKYYYNDIVYYKSTSSSNEDDGYYQCVKYCDYSSEEALGEWYNTDNWQKIVSQVTSPYSFELHSGEQAIGVNKLLFNISSQSSAEGHYLYERIVNCIAENDPVDQRTKESKSNFHYKYGDYLFSIWLTNNQLQIHISLPSNPNDTTSSTVFILEQIIGIN